MDRYARRQTNGAASADLVGPATAPTPGKQTLTAQLPASSAGAPVQRRAGPAGAALAVAPAPRAETAASADPPGTELLDASRPWHADDVRMTTPAQAPLALDAGAARQLDAGPQEFGRNPGAAGKAGVIAAAAADRGAHLDGGQVAIDGDVGAAMQGSRSLGELGASLGASLPFERYRVQRDGDQYAIEGKLNPWVRIAGGVVVEIRDVDMYARPTDGDDWRWVDAQVPVVQGQPLPPQPAPSFAGLPQPTRPTPLARTARPHESPTAYAERRADGAEHADGSEAALYRGIRGISNNKALAPTSAHAQGHFGPAPIGISAPPDGQIQPTAPFAQQRQAYQQLTAWPQGHHIQAADATADEPVARQVSGGNAATQYISTTQQLQNACRVSAYDYGAAGGLGGLRLPRFWGPVIHLDARRLPPHAARVYDLSSEGPHRDALFGETPSPAMQEVSGMAQRDAEVLVEGTIPDQAIMRVYSVAEVMVLLANADDTFLDQLRAKVIDEHTGLIANDGDRAIIVAAGLLDRVERRPAAEEEDDHPRKHEEKKRDHEDDDDDGGIDRKALEAARQRHRGAGRGRGGLRF